MVAAASISQHIPPCQCASGSAMLITDGGVCQAEAMVDVQ
jgi:hypothetical protein